MFMLMTNGFIWALIGLAVLGNLHIPQISTALFGGTAPSANDAIISVMGTTLVPAYFVMGACVIGFIATIFMKATRGASLRGAGLPEEGANIVFDANDLVDNFR